MPYLYDSTSSIPLWFAEEDLPSGWFLDAFVLAVLVAETTAFAEVGTATTLRVAAVLSATSATYTETGAAVGLRQASRLPSDAGLFTESGEALTLAAIRRLLAETTAYACAGTPVGVTHGRSLPGDAAAFGWSGQAATLVYTPVGNVVLDAEAGAFVAQGTAAIFDILTGYRVLVMVVEPQPTLAARIAMYEAAMTLVPITHALLAVPEPSWKAVPPPWVAAAAAQAVPVMGLEVG